MKPGNIAAKDSQHSINTGKAIAQMVTRYGLQKRAFLVSFDPQKSNAAKQENGDLVVGTFYSQSYWSKSTQTYVDIKNALQKLPGLATCFQQQTAPISSDRSFMDNLFESGTFFKSINASFVDMEYTIYDNPAVSNNTFATLRKNYNPKISAGAWTIYSMKLDAKKTEATESRVQSLIDQGAERLITDDVPRLRKKLGRFSSNGNCCQSYMASVIMSVAFAMLLLAARY